MVGVVENLAVGMVEAWALDERAAGMASAPGGAWEDPAARDLIKHDSRCDKTTDRINRGRTVRF